MLALAGSVWELGEDGFMTSRRRAAVRLLALAVILAGCGLRPPPGDQPDSERPPLPHTRRPAQGEGPGHRQQRLALNPEKELAVGRQAFKEVLRDMHDKVLPQDSPQTLRCRRIVDRLARAAQIEPLQREINLRIKGYTFEWEVRVVREGQVNAFCLPAGKMVVFTGILGITQNEDAYLATVLSHEMAHALAHHASERVARERGSGGRKILRSLSYQRMQESEADHIGVFLMAFAGYDPSAAVTFWQRMEQASGGRRPPEFLSDHPSHATRIRQLRKWSGDARAARRAFDAGRIARSQ